MTSEQREQIEETARGIVKSCEDIQDALVSIPRWRSRPGLLRAFNAARSAQLHAEGIIKGVDCDSD